MEKYYNALKVRIMKPDSESAAHHLGIALQVRGLKRLAAASFRDAIRLGTAKSGAEFRHESLAHLGLILAQEDRWQEALDVLDEAYRANPDDKTNANNYAVAKQKLQQEKFFIIMAILNIVMTLALWL